MPLRTQAQKMEMAQPVTVVRQYLLGDYQILGGARLAQVDHKLLEAK